MVTEGLAQVGEAFTAEVDAIAADLKTVTGAYWSLQSGGDPYVSLADVQAATGLDTARMGAALRYGAANDKGLHLDSEVLPSRITPRVKAAAVRFGGEPTHYMSLDTSARPASAAPSKPARKPTSKPATGGSKMPASTTAQAAAGKKPIITWPKPATSEINGNVSSAAYCNDAAFQFHQAAAYAEAMYAAVVNDMTDFLRENGLDGQRSVGPISYGSDARSASRKAAKPLKNIAADLENIAKQFAMLKRNLDQHVWDPVQQAQAEQERSKRSAAIRIGA